MSIRNTNIYVAAPVDPTSDGSYVGVETNDSTTEGTGSIQIRNSAISVVRPAIGDAYTASDILQTTPATFTTPNYRQGPGILIGPGTELVTKTAGDKGFSVYNYTCSILYRVLGLLNTRSITAGYIVPGSMFVTSSTYPLAPSASGSGIYYKIQQPTIIMGVSCYLSVGPGSGMTTTVFVDATIGVNITSVANVVFANTQTESAAYSSIRLDAGDYITVGVSYPGITNLSENLTVYLHLF